MLLYIACGDNQSSPTSSCSCKEDREEWNKKNHEKSDWPHIHHIPTILRTIHPLMLLISKNATSPIQCSTEKHLILAWVELNTKVGSMLLGVCVFKFWYHAKLRNSLMSANRITIYKSETEHGK